MSRRSENLMQNARERGDVGSIRRRLWGSVRNGGYDRDLIEQIAQVSIEMHDLYEAGRWFFIIDSQHPRANELIRYYIDSCGGIKHAAGRAPLKSRLADFPSLPAVVQDRLEMKPASYRVKGKANPQALKQSICNSVSTIIGLTLFMLILGFGIIGLCRFIWSNIIKP